MVWILWILLKWSLFRVHLPVLGGVKKIEFSSDFFEFEKSTIQQLLQRSGAAWQPTKSFSRRLWKAWKAAMLCGWWVLKDEVFFKPCCIMRGCKFLYKERTEIPSLPMDWKVCTSIYVYTYCVYIWSKPSTKASGFTVWEDEVPPSFHPLAHSIDKSPDLHHHLSLRNQQKAAELLPEKRFWTIFLVPRSLKVELPGEVISWSLNVGLVIFKTSCLVTRRVCHDSIVLSSGIRGSKRFFVSTTSVKAAPFARFRGIHLDHSPPLWISNMELDYNWWQRETFAGSL